MNTNFTQVDEDSSLNLTQEQEQELDNYLEPLNDDDAIPLPNLNDFESNALEDEEIESKKSFDLIKSSKFVKLLCKKHFKKNIKIIDCRFIYEYLAGRIKNAISIYNTQSIEQIFNEAIENEKNNVHYQKPMLVFYCEFSQNRGPEIASVFRRIDRHLNLKKYPSLYFDEIYILKGGFRSFYKIYQNFCDGFYCPMDDNGDYNIHSLFKDRKILIKNLLYKYGVKEPQLISASLSQPILF